jgi:isochorismate pyruvate lyase
MESPDSTPARDLVDLHRQHIDRIDRTIVALLAERMRLGRALGEIKREHAWPARVPQREADVLARVRRAASGPLAPESAARIFEAIIAETTAVQDRSNE